MKKLIAPIVSLLLCSCAALRGEPVDLSYELSLVTQDLRDAMVVIQDPDLQDDLADLVVQLDEVATLIASSEIEVDDLVISDLMEIADAVMRLPGVHPEVALALLGVKAVLRRL
jgi:hypothetical protein